ncbi:hypothetical protein DFP73DRAFT_558257 [Morchella snyderi]|nr:hypothetical protein DFP73DRAFT_558257 [Morchella snyderi]
MGPESASWRFPTATHDYRQHSNSDSALAHYACTGSAASDVGTGQAARRRITITTSLPSSAFLLPVIHSLTTLLPATTSPFVTFFSPHLYISQLCLQRLIHSFFSFFPRSHTNIQQTHTPSPPHPPHPTNNTNPPTNHKNVHPQAHRPPHGRPRHHRLRRQRQGLLRRRRLHPHPQPRHPKQDQAARHWQRPRPRRPLGPAHPRATARRFQSRRWPPQRPRRHGEAPRRRQAQKGRQGRKGWKGRKGPQWPQGPSGPCGGPPRSKQGPPRSREGPRGAKGDEWSEGDEGSEGSEGDEGSEGADGWYGAATTTVTAGGGGACGCGCSGGCGG